MTYTATIVEVLKNTDRGERNKKMAQLGSIADTDSKFLRFSLSAFEAVNAGTRVELLKKATCSTVTIQNNRLYLVMGVSGTEVIINRSFRSVSIPFHFHQNLFQLPAVSCFYLLCCFAPAGIASLWTRTRWWSCGPQSAAHQSVEIIWPT